MCHFSQLECILTIENFASQNYWGGGGARAPGSYAHEQRLSHPNNPQSFHLLKIISLLVYVYFIYRDNCLPFNLDFSSEFQLANTSLNNVETTSTFNVEKTFDFVKMNQH